MQQEKQEDKEVEKEKEKEVVEEKEGLLDNVTGALGGTMGAGVRHQN